MLSFRDHSKPWGLESVVIFPFFFFDVCLWFIYIFFWLVWLLVFLGWRCCLRGVLFFIWGWGWWFWIDLGGGGGGFEWRWENHVSYFRYATNDCQNNSYYILIIITWYLLHRSMYELLIEFVVSSESHFRKWGKKNEKNTYTCISIYIWIITTSWSHGVSTILDLFRASLLTFYHEYI